MYLDTRYNKCTILFTNDSWLGWAGQQNFMSAYETGTHPYVNTQNKKTKQTYIKVMKTQRKENHDDDNYYHDSLFSRCLHEH